MMDTPSDDTDTLRTRLLPSKRTLALVAVVVCLLTTPVLAQQSYDMADDFEDGNTRVEYDGWTGWAGDDIQTTSDAISGSYSGRLVAPGSETQNTGAYRDTNTTAVETVQTDIRIDNQTSETGVLDSVDVFLRDRPAGTTFTQARFEITRDNPVRTLGGDEILSSWQADTVYTVTWHNWDFDAGTVDITVEGGGQSGTATETFGSDVRFSQIAYRVEADETSETVRADIDNVQVQTAERYAITGSVTDQDRNEIREGEVQATDSEGNTFVAELNDTGGYEFEGLANDTYDVSTQVPGYLNETESVTVDGSSATQDFRLISADQALQLDTRHFIEHGQSVPYTVTATYVDNGSRVREEVTNESVVTSGDDFVVSVDEVERELVATDDESVNNRTYVQAEWENPDGETLTTRENVTVANKTVDNLEILPPVTRFAASIEDKTLQTILIATGVGTAAALLASVFAGVAGLTVIMSMGWLMGVVPDGIIMVTVVTAMFIGMNVAGNVDYTVRR